MSLKIQTVDLSWYRILHASTWRASFLEAAGNAATRVAEYSRNRNDYENAVRWEHRALLIREYAERKNTANKN
jgi:hypothetical protein